LSETVIPADPGWFVLTYTASRALRVPVVAWRITGATAEPVTMDPAIDILCPDGSVVGTFGHFRSQDLWQEAQQLAQDPRGWADDPPPLTADAPPPAPAASAPDAPPTDATPPTRMTLNGAALRQARPESSRPKPESKAAGLRRRRAIRRSRAASS
jgi:hypothetical protein